MSLMLHYDELFEPYTADGHSLENTIKFLSGKAAQLNIPSETMELAINEIFSKVANGYEYPKDHCPCGCGIDKAGTAITHAMLEKMIDLNNEQVIAVKDLIRKRYSMLVESEMKRVSKTNKEFIKMNRKPLSERSPILRTIKKWTTSQSQA